MPEYVKVKIRSEQKIRIDYYIITYINQPPPLYELSIKAFREGGQNVEHEALNVAGKLPPLSFRSWTSGASHATFALFNINSHISGSPKGSLKFRSTVDGKSLRPCFPLSYLKTSQESTI